MKTLITPLLLIALGQLAISTSAQAAAALGFSPQRIVMEDRQQSTVLRLTNRGDAPGTFRMTMKDVIYADDGGARQVDTPPPGYPSARPFVRFSPSQVRLAPGESQNVRVLLQAPQSIPQGELRVHLMMQQLPDAPGLENISKDDSLITAKMTIGQAVAIPIIVRRGETHATGGIAAASRTANGLNITLTRSGNRSLFTTIETYSGSIAPANLLDSAKGIAIPVPNPRRTLPLKFKKTSAQPYIVVVKDHNSGEIIAQRNVP